MRGVLGGSCESTLTILPGSSSGARRSFVTVWHISLPVMLDVVRRMVGVCGISRSEIVRLSNTLAGQNGH